mgnify:CR=1 FL=1
MTDLLLSPGLWLILGGLLFAISDRRARLAIILGLVAALALPLVGVLALTAFAGPVHGQMRAIAAQLGDRAAYVAVSNTVIGVLMLAGGVVGLIGDWLGAAAVVLVLGLASLLAAGYILRLAEVSEPG